MHRILLAGLMSVSFSPFAVGQLPTGGAPDDSQARAMVVFLRVVAEHHDAKALIDSLMAMKGTALLIAQQNVSRRVTPEQYRKVLLAFAEHREPRLAAPDGDARAMKGKEGLLQDVLPSLRWGSEHVDLVASRVAAVARLNAGAEARKLALDNLPEPVPADVPLYLVMGGRAGAAANDESQLHLDENGERAFNLLRGLVMEGSASYLINGHRNLTAMRKNPMFAAPGDDYSRMAAVEQILSGVLQQNWPRERYDEAMAQFAGNALHLTGAAMLDAIWRAGGRTAVMEVLRDPRQLLIRYNQSARRNPQTFHFSSPIAHQVAAVGD